MDIECEPELEYPDCFYFAKTLHENTDLCVVCQVDEIEDGYRWDRYKTRCGHVSHTRRFRRWCGKKGHLNCPLCGDTPETESNMYCNNCDVFGHKVLECRRPPKKKHVAQKPQNRRSRRSAQQQAEREEKAMINAF